MKTIAVVLMFTLVFALAMMAQTVTPAPPAAAAENAKACACRIHDKTDDKAGDKQTGEKTTGCDKDGGCCKDGKCDRATHKDGKMACCAGDKCPMKTSTSKDSKIAAGKSCCAGDKCPMMAKGQKGDHGCCCGNMTQHEHAGV